MSSTLKTSLIAATIALSVGLFAVQAAHAGGRHRSPFVPFNSYAPSAYDYDEVEYDGYARASRYGSEDDGAAAAARGIAREVLDADIGEVLDFIAE